MAKYLKNIPANDPLLIPEQRKIIDEIIHLHKDRPGAAMVVLGEVQSKIGWVSEAIQAYLADQLDIPASTIHGVVTFYSFFTTNPKGKHSIKFCMGTACYVGGVPQLIEKAKQVLGIDVGETTADGLITLEICRCVGACSQAPVIVVDEEVLGRVKPNKLPQTIKQLQN
ncbi:MAG TPA: NAD(P)H-dependent oxidoreductase subunit E [Anaerolineaceae bacterium]|nr:NAD(P)H-dependent oxidoreductase subunit E [Anaerolineaceae bacterium]